MRPAADITRVTKLRSPMRFPITGFGAGLSAATASSIIAETCRIILSLSIAIMFSVYFSV